MIERLKNYLNEEFKNIIENKEVIELKEELLANLVDKYDEFRNIGFSEDKAFVEAIKNIGNLDDILSQYRMELDKDKEVIIKKDIDSILYKHKSEDEYVFDKTMKKIHRYNFISLALALSSLVLFYGITIITYREIIGFTIQMILLIVSGVIFILNYYECKQLSKNMVSVFKNHELYVKLINYLKNMTSIAIFIVINSVFITIPYLIYDDGTFIKSILTFKSYIKVVGIYLIIGLALSYALLNIIENQYVQKIKTTDPLAKLSLFVKNTKFIYYLMHYIIYVVGLMIILIYYNKAHTFIVSLIFLIIGVTIYDTYILIKKRNYMSLRVLKIFYSVIVFIALNVIIDYDFGKVYLNHELELFGVGFNYLGFIIMIWLILFITSILVMFLKKLLKNDGKKLFYKSGIYYMSLIIFSFFIKSISTYTNEFGRKIKTVEMHILPLKITLIFVIVFYLTYKFIREEQNSAK